MGAAPVTYESLTYEALRDALGDRALPAMLVDLDALDRNTARLAAVAEGAGKNLRVASKSLRVPALLRRILAGGDPFRGLMCYAVPEAALLAQEGFDDLLVAYPTVQSEDLRILRTLAEGGTQVAAMVDDAEQVHRIAAAFAGADVEARLCIDLDMSLELGGRHVGVQRSPVRSTEAFARVVDACVGAENVRVAGVMGYEALVAGVGDRNPFAPLLNPAKRWLKARSVADVARKREAAAAVLAERGIELDFFNGGGTGSIDTTTKEDAVTEVTAGSGFLQSHLFDYYSNNRNEPAFCFALQATRKPEAGVVTCQSGGFIASGPTDADKAPVPFLPAGLTATGAEGFGEVQTPLRGDPAIVDAIELGDPVFFRPAKAGEIAERFDRYLLLEGGVVVDEVPTYRGMGYAFY